MAAVPKTSEVQDISMTTESSLILSSVSPPELQDFAFMEFYQRLRFSVYYVVIPVVSAVGIVGNVMSILVLYRHGLHKSSFILLIALAVADTIFLIGSYNIPKLIYGFLVPNGYYFPLKVAYVLYIWNMFNTFVHGVGRCCSLTLPVLITLERLICVFFPLKFNKIVTLRRTWVAIAIHYTFWIVYIIAMAPSTFASFQYDYIPQLNVTIGLHQARDLQGITLYAAHALVQLQGTIPVTFVALGCFIIGIKTRLQHIKRRRMTTSPARVFTARTTKMLLTVCIMYVIAGGYGCWHFYLSYSVDVSYIRMLTVFSDLLLCLNSSLNFVIYVAMNKTFRDTYRSLFVCFFTPETRVQKSRIWSQRIMNTTNTMHTSRERY